jgi:hypothetical protein
MDSEAHRGAFPLSTHALGRGGRIMRVALHAKVHLLLSALCLASFIMFSAASHAQIAPNTQQNSSQADTDRTALYRF